jgi:tetratricopeptide (TPR) repeat protein
MSNLLLPKRKNLENEIQRKMESLALLKLQHGPVHMDVIKATIDLSHTYIRNNAIKPSLIHINNALQLNLRLFNNINQTEEQISSEANKDINTIFALDEEKDQCDSLNNIILLSIALIHLKSHNFELCKDLINKVKQVKDAFYEARKELLRSSSEQNTSNDNEDDYSSIDTQQEEELFPILMLQGRVLTEMGRFDEAEQLFQKAWMNKESKKRDHILLLPVYLSLGYLYSLKAKKLNEQEDCQGYQEIIIKAIENYEIALKLARQYNHGYGMDALMILYKLVSLNSSIQRYEISLPFVIEIETLINEILQKILSIFSNDRNSYIGHIIDFMKWVCYVKTTLAFVLVKCSKFEEACRLLIQIILLNENTLSIDGKSVLEVSSLDPPQSMQYKTCSFVLKPFDTAILYKKLGTVYILLNHKDHAIAMYRRALFIIYNNRRQEQVDNGSMLSNQDDIESTIQDLLERIAKFSAGYN